VVGVVGTLPPEEGEGVDTYEVLLSLERLSLDTQTGGDGTLLIVGDDLVGGWTYTTTISQRSESGKGIMGESKQVKVCCCVCCVVDVLVSHMWSVNVLCQYTL
jgi:hypothetical protein